MQSEKEIEEFENQLHKLEELRHKFATSLTELWNTIEQLKQHFEQYEETECLLYGIEYDLNVLFHNILGVSDIWHISAY